MFRRLQTVWENQPPPVRSNLSMGGMTLGGVLLLHLIIPLLIRVLDIQQVFRYLPSPMEILVILLQLIFLLLAINALRVTYQFIAGDPVLTLTGVALAWLSLVLVAGAYLVRPDVVEKYVAYSGGRSYSSIYEDFSALCDAWEAEWQTLAENTDFTLGEKNLGALEGLAEAYEVRNTVMLNFGRETVDVGLACAVDGLPPEDAGRAASYKFSRIEGSKYRFYEELP